MKIYLYMNHGGMGNQMYQYAVARKLLEEYGGSIVCDLEKFSYKGATATQRGYALQQFKLTDKMVYAESAPRKLVYGALKKTMRFLCSKDTPERRYEKLTKVGLFVPDGYFDDYDPSRIMKGVKSIYVNGLFQMHKYFDSILPILREEFQLREPLNREMQQLVEQMEQENAVCVHWRRGDYLAPQYHDSLFVCDESYYKRAIEDISRRIKEPVFYVFTNSAEDAEYIKSILKVDFEMKYINLILKEARTDVEDFALMCKCRHYIISNSTYSWWAQYLSSHPKKIVYAPSVWNRKQDARALYQDNWTIIDVD